MECNLWHMTLYNLSVVFNIPFEVSDGANVLCGCMDNGWPVRDSMSSEVELEL